MKVQTSFSYLLGSFSPVDTVAIGAVFAFPLCTYIGWPLSPIDLLIVVIHWTMDINIIILSITTISGHVVLPLLLYFDMVRAGGKKLWIYDS